MIYVLILVAFAKFLVTMLNKVFLQKSASSKEFFFVQTIVITLLGPVLFLVQPFYVEWSVISILLIIGIALFRAIDMKMYAKALRHISPLEMISYSTITIVITYLLDTLLGVMVFNIFVMLALLITLIGVFIITKSHAVGSKVALQLGLYILAAVGRGYLIYFALNYMSASSYLVLSFIVTSLYLVITQPQLFKTVPKKNWFITAKIQMLGLTILFLNTILASSSVTLYMLAIPTTLLLSIMLTPLFKKTISVMPSIRQFLGAGITLIGILGYSLLQI